MGYKEGKGHGKAEKRIKEPIKIIEKFNHKHNNNGKSKLMFILSNSMPSNIDPIMVDVRFNACTIICQLFLLHIATNDCVNTTSDKAIKELGKLKVFIQKALPSCRI